VLRLESSDIEAVPHGYWMLLKVGICAGDRHQPVAKRFVAPDQRVRFAAERIDRAIPDVLKIDEYGYFRFRRRIAGPSGRRIATGYPKVIHHDECLHI
jgi:hypothetical protein